MDICEVYLCLVYQEMHKGNTEEAASEPDEEYLGLEIRIALSVVDEIRRRIGDCEV